MVFKDAVTFAGATTYAGAVTGAATVQGADLVATDDLTVGDDATIGGDLAVTGAVSGATLTATTSLTVTGASVVGLEYPLTVDVADLSGTAVYGVPVPHPGTVVKIYTRLKAPLSVGDATLTASIGATGITDGVVTIAEAASAIGDIDSATPSALNTVVAGSDLNVTVGGSNASAVGATVTFIVRRSA